MAGGFLEEVHGLIDHPADNANVVCIEQARS